MSDCEIKELKEQLAQLIFEYDDLESHVCPEIEISYILEFGMDEYELYKIELEIEKLERKLLLINAENGIDTYDKRSLGKIITLSVLQE